MRALVIVDVQKDYCPGGAWPVPGGAEVVPIINGMKGRFDLVEAVKDWHPAGHVSFASAHGMASGETILVDGSLQPLHPGHCVQGTRGAELADGLQTAGIDRVFLQGTDPQVDSYSGFFDEGRRRSTGLREHLVARGVDEVFVAGLSTERCVKWTALDARRLGFESVVVLDACRGGSDAGRAVDEMSAAGVRLVVSAELPDPALQGAPVPRPGQEKFLI